MKTPTVSPFIDRYHPQKDGKCAVSIRVTFDRKKKYYKTGVELTPGEFDRVINAKRRTEAEKEHYQKINSFESRALEIVGKMPVFTFSLFEEIYLENREATDGIAPAFDKYISELKEERRIGTAVSYETARNSLNEFREGLKFADITKRLLGNYESWMLENGKSKTTVGIYLRSLRTIFNRAAIDKKLYPFGNGKGKYSIPTGRNVKKALALDEISKIFSYEIEPGTKKDMARDYWIFLYLCNGLNVKDLCLLKRKNIEGELMKYTRAKTNRSKKEVEKITVSLKAKAKEIIQKWAIPSISPDAYLFPHLQKGMTAEREREIYQQLTKTINKYMKVIARELGIDKPLTTYYARHSFATILKRSGVSMEFISEALGHSDLKTTKSYLDGFDSETIHSTTDVLLPQAK